MCIRDSHCPLRVGVKLVHIVNFYNSETLVGGDTKGIITNKKLVLTNRASRLVKKAEAIIKNVGSGRFPL